VPQNAKDSQCVKNHSPKKTAAKGQTGDKAQSKKSSVNSPTEPHKHGVEEDYAVKQAGRFSAVDP
jgi:hypothetical protein